jgi:hypothetical protein
VEGPTAWGIALLSESGSPGSSGHRVCGRTEMVFFFSRALDWSMETTVFLSVLIVDFDF